MAGIVDRILEHVKNPDWVRDSVAKARQATGGPNACAATLSMLLIDLELIDKVHTWTAELVGTEEEVGLLEKQHPVERIRYPSEVRAGDLVASRDLNANKVPDHVFVAAADPEGSDQDNPFCLVIDNYCRNGKPYWRNLGKSGWYGVHRCTKTPMAYALRFVEPAAVSEQVAAARLELVQQFPHLYQLAKSAELSPATLHYLNALRWSVELGQMGVD